MKISTGLLAAVALNLIANLIFPIEYGYIVTAMFLCTYAIVGAIEELQK